MKTMGVHRAVALFMLAAAASAPAQFNWTGGADNLWTNANNWFIFTAPADGDDITFDANAAANRDTDLGRAYSIHKLTVSDVPAAVTISNYSLTLGEGGLDMAGALADLSIRCPLTLGAGQLWTVGPGRTVTINGTLGLGTNAVEMGGDGNQYFPNLITGSGTNGIVKSGAGTMTLGYTGGNTFSGGVFVAGGTLKTVSDYGNTRVPADSTITVNTGATLWVSGINSLSVPARPGLRIQGGSMIVEGYHQHLGTLTLSDAMITTLGSGKYQGEDWAQDADLNVLGGASSITLGNSLALNALRTITVADGASLAITGRIVNGQITKAGGGRLALAGTNGINGTLQISGGTVALQGLGAVSNVSAIALATGATFDVTTSGGFTLAAAQTLSGWGTVSGVLAAVAGAAIAPGGYSTVGVLAVSGDLSLPGATNLVLDLPPTNSPGSPHDRVTVSGTLSLNNDALRIAGLTAVAPGVYTVLTYGAKSGSFAPDAGRGARQTIAVDETVAGEIRLVVSAALAAADLRWDSMATDVWDTALTTNWYNNGTLGPDRFFSDDFVTFDDTAGVITQVTVAAAGVAPGGMRVETTNNAFTIAGPGAISGPGGLTKSGPAPLTLGTTNLFTGEIQAQGGVIKSDASWALGQATSIVVASGARVDLNGKIQNPNGYVLSIAGVGPDGLGAFGNTGGGVFGGNSGAKYLRLTGDAALGAHGPGTNDNGRFDVATGGGWIDGGGFTLTKLGYGPLALRGPVSNLVALVVSNGLAYAEDDDRALGTNVVAMPGGSVGAFNGRTPVAAVQLAGGALVGWSGISRWTNTITALADSYVINDATIPSYGAGDINLDAPIGGPGRLTKLSGNTTFLRRSATNDGGWVVNGGTLVLDGTLVSTGGVFVSNGTFQVGSYGYTSSVALAADVTVDASRELRWNNALPVLFTNSILGNGMVRKEDLTQQVEWRGTNTMDYLALGSETSTRGTNGPLVLSGDSLTYVRDFDVGYTPFGAAYGRVDLRDRATLVLANWDIGNDSGGFGDVYQFGGSVTVTGNSGTFGLRLGHWNGGTNFSFYYKYDGRLELIGDTGNNGNLSVGWDGNGLFTQYGGTTVVRNLVLDNNGASLQTDVFSLEGGVVSIGQGIFGNAGSAVMNLGGGTLRAHANWTGSMPMGLYATNGVTVFDSSTNVITLTGALSGTGGLVKVGSGRLDLNAAHTFSGTMAVSAGAVRVIGGNLPNSAATTVHVGPGARLTLNKVNDFGGGHGTFISTGLIIDGGVLETLGDSETRVPALDLRGATVALNGGDTGGAWGSLFIPEGVTVGGASATLITNDPAAVESNLRVGSNTVFSVADAAPGGASDLDVYAPVFASPAGMGFTVNGLTKAGPGTMTLFNTNNTYGYTHVSNGTLAVMGVSGTGAVDVASGATLAGTGVVRSGVVNAGTVAPGPGTGTLTVQGTLSQLSGSSLAFELAGTVPGSGYDVLAVAGAVSLDGTLAVATNGGFAPVVSNTFTLLTAGSIAGGFAATNLPPLGAGLGWDVQVTATAVSLVVTGSPAAGPTPYDLWAQAIPNPAQRGDQEDPDGDGLANLLEYSQGSSPTNAADTAKLAGRLSNGVFAVIFNRVNTATDIIYEVQGAATSTNGADWGALATNVLGSWGVSTNVLDDNTALVHRVTVTDLEVGTNRTLRLKITRP